MRRLEVPKGKRFERLKEEFMERTYLELSLEYS